MGDVTYLEDDADQYSDEPKPKADVMTVNRLRTFSPLTSSTTIWKRSEN